MSEHETDQNAMSDTDVETLLFDFFQREMPSRLSAFPGATLPQKSVPRPVERATVPVAQPGREAGVGVVVVTVCLVIALTTVFSPDPNQHVGDDRDSGKPERNAAVASPDDVTEGLVIETIEEHREPAERATFDTTDGPVEMRIERPITNVTLFDRESGTNVEVEFPGIEIEIIPIDDDE